MKKIFFLLAALVLLLLSCADENYPDADEQQIFSYLIDSVFNESYSTVVILDSTMSVMRFATKTTFSEDLFGQEPLPYLISFFQKKECRPDKALLKAFTEQNREKYLLAGRYQPQRNHIYASYRSVYDFMYGSLNKDNDLYETVRSGKRFGIISFSRVGYSDGKDRAMMEVNIFRKRRGENFYLTLKRKDGGWRIQSKCYAYGPYKVKETP